MAIGIYKKSNGEVSKLNIFESKNVFYEIELMYDDVLHINKYSTDSKYIFIETFLRTYLSPINRKSTIDRFIRLGRYDTDFTKQFSSVSLGAKIISRSSIYY